MRRAFYVHFPVGHAMNPAVLDVPPGMAQAARRAWDRFPLFRAVRP